MHFASYNPFTKLFTYHLYTIIIKYYFILSIYFFSFVNIFHNMLHFMFTTLRQTRTFPRYYHTKKDPDPCEPPGLFASSHTISQHIYPLHNKRYKIHYIIHLEIHFLSILFMVYICRRAHSPVLSELLCFRYNLPGFWL